MTICPKLTVTHQLDGITLIPTRRHNPTVLALEFGGLLYTDGSLFQSFAFQTQRLPCLRANHSYFTRTGKYKCKHIPHCDIISLKYNNISLIWRSVVELLQAQLRDACQTKYWVKSPVFYIGARHCRNGKNCLVLPGWLLLRTFILLSFR